MEYNSMGVRPSSGQFDRHGGDLSTSYNPSVDSYVVMNGGLEVVLGGVQLREICQTPAAADHHRGWPESATSSSLQWAKMQQQQQQQQGQPFSYSVAATSSAASLGAPLSSTAMSPLMLEAVDVDDRRGLLEATTLQRFNPDHEMPSYSNQFGSARFSTQLPFRQQMAPCTVPLALVQSLLCNPPSCDDADPVPPAAIVESTSSQYRVNPIGVDRMGGGDGLHLPVAGPKRIRDKSTGKALHHHRKKAEKNQSLCLPPGAGKLKFHSLEQPDHIVRERQRRDDMASKFTFLETLLPLSSKRDRSTIVSDSAEYAKNLHHRIDILQQRRAEMMNVASAAAAAAGAASPSAATSHGNATMSQLQDHHPNNNSTWLKPLTTSSPVLNQFHNSNSSLDAAGATTVPPCLSRQVQQQYNSNKMLHESYDRQAAAAAGAAYQADSKKISNTMTSLSFPTEDLRESNAELKSCVEMLDVFPDLPHKLVIKMICRPQLKFQSNVLQGMESLQLEVLQCSISRVAFEHVICIISAKPWDVSTYDAMCEDGIKVAVNCALGPDSWKQQQTKARGPQLLP